MFCINSGMDGRIQGACLVGKKGYAAGGDKPWKAGGRMLKILRCSLSQGLQGGGLTFRHRSYDTVKQAAGRLLSARQSKCRYRPAQF